MSLGESQGAVSTAAKPPGHYTPNVISFVAVLVSPLGIVPESRARTKPLARRTLRVYKSHTPVESCTTDRGALR
jgi:hypothetical protein